MSAAPLVRYVFPERLSPELAERYRLACEKCMDAHDYPPAVVFLVTDDPGVIVVAPNAGCLYYADQTAGAEVVYVRARRLDRQGWPS